ncbi:MAG TPA: hypothetical protein VJL81_11205 [Solirubrobacterales bacterium]|nr:hypothetical protein [Solirubrobacterales bacterium]
MAERDDLPGGLGQGAQLRMALVESLPEGFDWDERSTATLGLLETQIEDLVEVEEAIEKHGVMTKGSTGQLVVNPAIAEARQQRAAVNRLIQSLPEVDEDTGKVLSENGRRAQVAAQARWRKLAEEKRRAREAAGLSGH